MWRKKTFWSSSLVSGNKRIEIEGHEMEGVLHYYAGSSHYIMGYSAGTDDRIRWGIFADTVAEVDTTGKETLVSTDVRDKIIAEICQATMDVWKMKTMPIPEPEGIPGI